MNQNKRCAYCKRLFHPNPRVKNQRYCSRRACQRARKTLWQKQKMAADPDYQQNQKESQKNWCKNNPDCWRNYRRQNPDYVKHNRVLQIARNAKRRSMNNMIAKMDSLKPNLPIKAGAYFIVTSHLKGIAKMDALAQEVHIIPTG